MARTEAHAARNQALRAGFTSVKAARSLIPPTNETVESQARELNVSHTVEEIPDSRGAKLHWLGDNSAPKVLLYLHGGGYALAPLGGHVSFALQCLEKSGQGSNTVLGFLEYSLSDVAGFPTQMIQATECLRHLVNKGRPPSSIVVAGDSAGGNLCLALMSNILHPYPETQPLILKEKLAGLLMISPWVSCDTDTQSYKDFSETDIAPASLLEEMGKAFVKSGDRNCWSEPYLAGPSWWADLPATQVLLTVGGAEMFKVHILKVQKDLLEAGANLKTIVCEDQIHVECILDSHTGLEPGKMSVEIWDWMKAVQE